MRRFTDWKDALRFINMIVGVVLVVTAENSTAVIVGALLCLLSIATIKEGEPW